MFDNLFLLVFDLLTKLLTLNGSNIMVLFRIL